MEERKDIGKLFKENLGAMQQEVPEDLWERIDTTLDAKKRRKRRFFWLLFSAVGLIIIGVGYFWMLGNTAGPEESEKQTLVKTSPSVEMESEENEMDETTIITPNTDSLTGKDPSEEPIKKNTPGHSEVKKKTDTYLDSFTETKTTYYYYRSSDEQKIITTDKSKVDSLIEEHNRSVFQTDSVHEEIPVKKKDSLMF